MTFSQRIALSAPWLLVAAVLTPAHLLRERAEHASIRELFGEPPDASNAIKWYELLTFGLSRWISRACAFAAKAWGR